MLPNTAGLQTMLRRQNVLALWSRGYGVRSIAATLESTEETIRSDIASLQTDLQRDVLPQLRTRVQRAASVRLTVQQEAWELYHRLEDNAHNKVAALTVVLQAQDALDKLTGVSAPEEISATAVAEMQEAVMHALYAVGGQPAQQAFLRILRDQATVASDYLPTPYGEPEPRPLNNVLPLPSDFEQAEGDELDDENALPGDNDTDLS